MNSHDPNSLSGQTFDFRNVTLFPPTTQQSNLIFVSVSEIMAELSSKDMTTKFIKIQKFQGVDFWRWQNKMHFLLTTLKVVYVLSTPMPEEKEDETPAEIRKRCKWENDDYICRGHILNGMSDPFFDIYQNYENAKSLWDNLESNYKMVDSRSVMDQYNELLHNFGQFTLHKMNMHECIAVQV